MKILLFVVAVCAVESCQGRAQEPQSSQSDTTHVPIINFSDQVGENGQYNFSYETGNGIKVVESGLLKHLVGLRARSGGDESVPDEQDVLVQSGSYSYTAPDGQVISLTYVADENGFQPQGAHIPTPPPIPMEIQKLLKQLTQQTEPNPAES